LPCKTIPSTEKSDFTMLKKGFERQRKELEKGGRNSQLGQCPREGKKKSMFGKKRYGNAKKEKGA